MLKARDDAGRCRTRQAGERAAQLCAHGLTFWHCPPAHVSSPRGPFLGMVHPAPGEHARARVTDAELRASAPCTIWANVPRRFAATPPPPTPRRRSADTRKIQHPAYAAAAEAARTGGCARHVLTAHDRAHGTWSRRQAQHRRDDREAQGAPPRSRSGSHFACAQQCEAMFPWCSDWFVFCPVTCPSRWWRCTVPAAGEAMRMCPRRAGARPCVPAMVPALLPAGALLPSGAPCCHAARRWRWRLCWSGARWRRAGEREARSRRRERARPGAAGAHGGISCRRRRCRCRCRVSKRSSSPCGESCCPACPRNNPQPRPRCRCCRPSRMPPLPRPAPLRLGRCAAERAWYETQPVLFSVAGGSRSRHRRCSSRCSSRRSLLCNKAPCSRRCSPCRLCPPPSPRRQ